MSRETSQIKQKYTKMKCRSEIGEEILNRRLRLLLYEGNVRSNQMSVCLHSCFTESVVVVSGGCLSCCILPVRENRALCDTQRK